MTASTRLKLGITLAIGGNVLFFTSAWIAWMPWSAATKAAVWGALFFAPEVGTLLGAAIMGKENYERFKEVAFAFMGRIKPAGDIGVWRHRIGIVMFLMPIVPTYIQAYKPEWLPDGTAWRWEIKIASDLIFIASLFVLGGDFWDKLHALFIREARAQKTGKSSATASSDEIPPAA
ncbi:MAG: hypothetical protein WCN98_03410 [Verrucomicrobiaceae bacterium]